ncbi:hypothetical protein ACLSZR_08090 [Avibacterium avium]|uniref:hypothetical protein n=1 Tax=Avibacterium avium TaxID=751 RepID=UPI003BF907B2
MVSLTTLCDDRFLCAYQLPVMMSLHSIGVTLLDTLLALDDKFYPLNNPLSS